MTGTIIEMKNKSAGFGDPELDDLLASIHKSIRENPKWKKESAVELVKRLRRETTHCVGA